MRDTESIGSLDSWQVFWDMGLAPIWVIDCLDSRDREPVSLTPSTRPFAAGSSREMAVQAPVQEVIMPYVCLEQA